ncbi:MAG: hypothetical protein LW850_09810, partial [Planctomycetaceae bacterium]|nr:hypothetical protein [Planctomycetaceae bacterium]
RTKRVALKVQPHYPTTDLKLGIRGQPNSAVPGAEVYLRTPGSDDLKMLGRTDWRGMIGVTNTELPTITYDQPTSSSVEMIARARATAIRLKSLKENQSSANEGGSDGAEDPAVAAAAADEAAIAAAAEAAKKRERAPTRSMQIKLPLYLYYIKNGETLLARLPMITGYREQEKADLPDDRRRLQAEAFLKGLQGEVLDLVVRRKILDARIKKKIEDGKKDEAFALLDELKKVKNYEALSAQIQNILRRATSTEMGPVPGPVAERIDKMIDATRVLMQQYLQTDIVRELEVKLLGGAAPSATDQGQPAAAGTGANGELGETYSIQGHSIQLPKGFKAVPDTRLPAGVTLVSFEGPKRSDETFLSLLVGVMEKEKVDPKLTQEQHMEARLAVIAKNHKDWQASEQSETTINGVKFSKKTWKGIGVGIEKEVRGISYVAINNGQLIWLSVQDIAPNFDTIPLGEASLMTFK